MSQVVLRGQWTPTQQELDRLRTYPRSDAKGRPVFFVPGREPYVSLILTGDERPEEIEVDTRYFVDIRGSEIGNPRNLPGKSGRLRRTAWVFPWKEFNKTDDPEMNLEYIARPLTVLEAWRATREFLPIYRQYKDGTRDAIHEGWDGWEVAFANPEDEERLLQRLGRLDRLAPEDIQSEVDALDWTTPERERPDWRLL